MDPQTLIRKGKSNVSIETPTPAFYQPKNRNIPQIQVENNLDISEEIGADVSQHREGGDIDLEGGDLEYLAEDEFESSDSDDDSEFQKEGGSGDIKFDTPMKKITSEKL